MDGQIKILFLCTGNACRSQMAEAILRHLGGGRFFVASAGSHPAGYVHPLAITALDQLGIPMVNPRSKSWDEFADTDFDVVITLCDSAAGESCPDWRGRPVVVHWSHPDPVSVAGTDDQRIAFAVQVAGRLRLKVERLMEIDFAKCSRVKIGEALRAIAAE
jgi:arsenate reductase (thioredoxin)